jgi:uncharacterized membrane protein (DUF373 family)
MRLRDEIREARRTWSNLTLYRRFEYCVTLILAVLIAIVIASATWYLAVNIGLLIFTGSFAPTNQLVIQGIFGMIIIVIIALEFEHSLLVVLAREESIIRLRTVLVIAMLAMVRKFIVLDVNTVTADELIGLAAAILALGIVHWLVRDQDRRSEQDRRGET